MLQSIRTDVPFRGLGEAPFMGAVPCVLGKRTVIYGRNGSGKTTLSEALRLGAAGKADLSTITARVVVGGEVSSVDLGRSGMPFVLFVYNRYYVEDTLKLFLDGDGEALPILKLGEQSVQAEIDIRAAKGYLTALERRQADLAAVEKRIRLGRETVEKQTKADIIAALASSDNAFYNHTRYQVTIVRRRLDNEMSTQLTESELAAELAAATARTLEPVVEVASAPTVGDPIRLTINDELLGISVESVQVPRLAENRTLSGWIEAGLDLHEAGDVCAFCQAGTVTADTLETYRGHFNSALEELRDRLTKAIDFLEDQTTKVREWLDGLPKVDAFLPDFQERVRKERDEVARTVTDLESTYGDAVDRIRRRLADPLTVIPASERLANAFFGIDVGGLQKMVAENNGACGSQASRIAEAKAAVEAHYGAMQGKTYRELGERLPRVERARMALTSREDRVRSEILTLEQSQQDVGRMANLIDADLRDHFGHAHLRVSVSADGKGYVVTRAGSPAARLSEGERNAIAFCYFLRSLEAEGVERHRAVVVIDDPVTSLDKEGLFAAFALAENRTADIAQTIVLTHDYEYFRLQLMENTRKWHTSQNRINGGGDRAEALMPAVSLLEIRAVTSAGGSDRRGEVRQIPRSLIQHPSEYHFLFLHVVEAVQGASEEYLPLVGNACRRLLEGFLSFRAPSGIKFQEKVDAVAQVAGIDPSLKERVVKFLHSQSHREEPRPSAALDFPSIKAELIAALAFIQKADTPHFNAMCAAVGVETGAILTHFPGHRSMDR